MKSSMIQTDEQIFEQVVENSFDSSWVLSLPSFKLEYANQTTVKLLGYPLENFYQDNQFWYSLVHVDDKLQAIKANEECLNQGASEARYRMNRADGKVIWVLVRLKLMRDAEGWPRRVIGNSMDVTESTVLEQDLRSSNELFYSLATFAPVGIYKTDLTGAGIFMNHAWFEIAGLNWENSKGEKWANAIHPEDRDRVLSDWQASTSEGRDFYCEFRFKNPVKGERHVFSRATPVRDIQGKISGFVGCIEDTTERIEAEKTLIAHRERLVASAKMSSLGEMASGIAHEINSPLTIIVGLCTKLKRLLKKPPMDLILIEKELSRIESTAFRIAKIIKGLRTFSRNSEQDPMEFISVSRLVEDTLELCKERFDKFGVELRVSMDRTCDLEIEARPSQITQVLLNLLGNAFDAVENLPEKWVELNVQEAAGKLRVRVSDSGSGIPESIVQKLMDPFFTTKEVGKGTGLGLSISKGIVEDYSGVIYYDKMSLHTAFVVELPIRSEAEESEISIGESEIQLKTANTKVR